ncbi:hypothetical protein IFR05_016718 [Cadophora sp. M221]|nr:hypothetical protein IFR05_016718 [Cadophora sp. M221]
MHLLFLLIVFTIYQFVSAEEDLQPECNKAKPSLTSVYVAPASEYVAPLPSSRYIVPTPSPETDPKFTFVTSAAVVRSSTYVAPALVDTESPLSILRIVAATTSAQALSATTYFSDPSGGSCVSEYPCSGDITYYEAGLGACGVTTDGSVEKVIALPVGLMGVQSNDNPYCGKTVTIRKGSKTTVATVVDKCMGCEGNSIDLSNAAFLELADLSVGRTTAEWWFN